MTDWSSFWDAKATSSTDFEATGRSVMDPLGFLHTVHDIAVLLDLGSDDVLLDLGCGSGLLALAFAPFVARVHGQDLSRAMTRRAAENLRGISNADFTVGDATSLPFAAGSIDKVLAYSVVQYLRTEETARGALAEVARVLRSGGRAALAANPDPGRRRDYEEVLHERSDRADLARNLSLLDDILWIAPPTMKRLCDSVGLTSTILPISPRIWQHFYMFDLVVERAH